MRNGIVPLNATPAPERDARRGPKAVTVPLKPKATLFGRQATATTAEMISTQEQRMIFVRAQRRHTAFQVFYGFFGIALMMVHIEYLWLVNTQTLSATCPMEASTGCFLCFNSLHVSVPVSEGRMILLALRVLIAFSTGLMLYYVYLYYTVECEVMKLKKIMPPKATLLGSSLRRTLLLEVIVLGIHPFPGIEKVDPKWPQLTVAASLLMFTRVALIVRVVQFRNSFNSSNGWFIGALTNVDFTTTFFLKSTLKNYPSTCLLASITALGCTAGYSLYVAERFLCVFKKDSCCQPMLLGDAIWMLVITILTIGYGDVVPRTTLGRAIAVSAGAFGTLSTAVTIAVMSNYIILTRSEHKVNAFLKKDENRRLINEHAARALQAYVQLRAAQRRHTRAAFLNTDHQSESGALSVTTTDIPTDSKSVATDSSTSKRSVRRAELKLFTVLAKYRQLKRRVQSQDVSDPMDSQMTMLEMMEVNVEYIRAKIEELSELFVVQTGNRSRNDRKSSNMLVAAVTEVEPLNGEAPLSTSRSIASLHQLQQEPNQSQAHPQQLYPLQQSRTMPTLQESTSSSLTPVVHKVATKSDASASQPARENVPTWALVLESTLQNLLEQVSRVSDEVETMKTRVQTHSESIETRIKNLEKRVVVSDALHEISTARISSRNPHRRNSKPCDGTAGNASSTARLRRLSAEAYKRPSVHDFVTPSELVEFQTPDEDHGHA